MWEPGGGGGEGAIAHFLQEEVNRSTPSAQLMRDVSGGSAVRLLSRLPALHSSLAQPAHAMLSVWAPPHGTPSQTVCNPGNETQAHLSIKIA